MWQHRGVPSLTREEAQQRAQLINVDSMEVALDLDRGVESFGSTTRIRFSCSSPGESTFLDLRPVSVESIQLNGEAIAPDALVDGRLPLADLAADNTVEVVASMAYSRDGQGLHRSTDPADDEDYVYGHLFLDAAPKVFACFDQPDLKARMPWLSGRPRSGSCLATAGPRRTPRGSGR